LGQCTALKPNGERCRLVAMRDSESCWSHDPSFKEKRKRHATRAGKAKPNRELASIKTRLSDLADDVLADKVDKGVAAVASQVLNVYLRAMSVELRVREQMELIERLESLEEGLEQQRGERRYGA
jgi:hypothetical protein